VTSDADARAGDADREAVRALVRLSRMLERACPELSLPHYRVLAAVADGDERASRVAARLALGKPTISASVDALCRRGLLHRDEVANDQRAAALRLTPAGATLLAEAEAAMTARLAGVTAHTRRGADARDGLTRLGAGLDRLVAEHGTDRTPDHSSAGAAR
jgi:DNA-binding MarR family transcriptional regulator